MPESGTGLVTDTVLLNNDIYLVGAKDFSDDAAYAVVKVLWDNLKELWAAYPALASWQQSRMVSKNAFFQTTPERSGFSRKKACGTRRWTICKPSEWRNRST